MLISLEMDAFSCGAGKGKCVDKRDLYSASRAAARQAITLVMLVLAFSVGFSTEANETDIRRDATVTAVERVMPCVVNIATETVINIRDPFEEILKQYFNIFRRPQANSQVSLGSGVIIDEDGYILTNDHVVRRATKIWVKVNTNSAPYEAKLIASNSRIDVALIKIQAQHDERFTAVRLAEDDDLLLGETVLSLGNPFGLGGSVSRGILSSKNRVVPKDAEQLDWPNWLQTDASINPGNSGGPLVNLRGELIGLNVAMLSEAQGIGFAIPIKLVREALSGILTPENSGKGLWFGAKVKAGSTPVVVTTVQANSPAQKAGLKPGDTILELNGLPPKNFIDFNELLTRNPKNEARLLVQRGTERRDLTVKLVPESSFFNAELIDQRLGIRLQQLTPQLARSFGLNSTEGLLVADVESETPAAEVLRSGYLVTAIDGQACTDLTSVAKLLYPKKKGENVRLDFVAQQRRGAFIAYQQMAAEIPIR